MSKEFMSFKGFLIELTKHSNDHFVGTLVDSNPLVAFEFKRKDLHGVWAEYMGIVNGLTPDHSFLQNIFDDTFDADTFIGRRIMQAWAESVRGQILTVKAVKRCSDPNYFMVSGQDQDGKDYELMLRKGQNIRVLKAEGKPQATVEHIFNELGATNLDDALSEIIKLKLGYQPWRDRRGEILSKPVITDAERQELKELEDKLMPLGWRASFGHSHEDVQAMEIIRTAAALLKNDIGG